MKNLLTGTSMLALALSMAVGCSSSDGDGEDKDGTGGTSIVPPTRPSGPNTSDSSTRTFAIDALNLGGSGEWKKLGYNIDGKVSRQNSTDVCKAVEGAIKPPHEDGNGGIDNAFGNLLLPILDSAAPGVAGTVNDALSKGTFTVLLQVNGLPADASGDLSGLSGQLFAGGVYGEAPPAFDKSTDWPVLAATLNNENDITSGSKIKFSNSYVSNGTFVSGDRTTVSLNLTFAGVNLNLSVRNAVVTFKPNGSSVAEGVISGVLVTSELEEALKKVGGNISAQLCGGSLETFLANLRTSSDIMSNGSADPNSTCDAISVGIGFTAKEVANPTKIAPKSDTEAEDLCNTAE